MTYRPNPGWMERIAERMGLIESLPQPAPGPVERLAPEGQFVEYPPADRWDDWPDPDPPSAGLESSSRYALVPTVCFNCEASCGLLAYVNKDRMEIRKFEGNPMHPGSRGRNCAKGPATINQIRDPDRILYPQKRAGRPTRRSDVSRGQTGLRGIG